MKKYIKSSNIFGRYYKVKYEVRWVSPDGKNCLLGGSNSLDEANEIAQRQAEQIFDSPFESTKRKLHFLSTIEVVDIEAEQDATSIDTEDLIDNLMSELDSRR